MNIPGAGARRGRAENLEVDRQVICACRHVSVRRVWGSGCGRTSKEGHCVNEDGYQDEGCRSGLEQASKLRL